MAEAIPLSATILRTAVAISAWRVNTGVLSILLSADKLATVARTYSALTGSTCSLSESNDLIFVLRSVSRLIAGNSKVCCDNTARSIMGSSMVGTATSFTPWSCVDCWLKLATVNCPTPDDIRSEVVLTGCGVTADWASWACLEAVTAVPDWTICLSRTTRPPVFTIPANWAGSNVFLDISSVSTWVNELSITTSTPPPFRNNCPFIPSGILSNLISSELRLPK